MVEKEDRNLDYGIGGCEEFLQLIEIEVSPTYVGPPVGVLFTIMGK